MLMLPPAIRIFLALEPVDMRLSFDALAAKVQFQFQLDPLTGHLFCFTNKPRTLLKILFFDRSGYCILYKRLEQGSFQLPHHAPGEARTEIDPTTLALILEGIDLHSVKRRKRYHRPPQASHHQALSS
jgi:transposase